MEVNACKQGDSRRVAYLAVEQGGQSVPACQLVEALTHAGLAFGREHLMPLTKLAEGALPEDLGESVPVFALEGFAWLRQPSLLVPTTIPSHCSHTLGRPPRLRGVN